MHALKHYCLQKYTKYLSKQAILPNTKQVTLSGAVEGKAVWPQDVEPVAWHEDANTVRMKLGLYHKTDLVHDGEVEYRDISIEGPNGEKQLCGRKGVASFCYCCSTEGPSSSDVQWATIWEYDSA